ncbi:hypothetical protein M3J09_013907 [Ascochyta lentis]
MKFIAIFSTLLASTLALNILQEDGSVRALDDTDLLPRQFPQCCDNLFNPPCGCPTTCGGGCSQACCPK